MKYELQEIAILFRVYLQHLGIDVSSIPSADELESIALERLKGPRRVPAPSRPAPPAPAPDKPAGDS